MAFRKAGREKKKIVAPPATAGLLAQTDLGWQDWKPGVCAWIGSG